MRIEQAIRNFLTGVTRMRPPTNRATLGAAHQAYGTWQVVAAAMGVSDRTLRRIRKGQVSPRSQQRLAGLSQDPAVRRASITPAAARRINRMQTNRTRITIQGNQGPVGYGDGDYRRSRTIDFTASPETMNDMLNAFFNGDDRGAAAAFHNAVMSDYADDTILGIQEWDVDLDVNISFDVQ